MRILGIVALGAGLGGCASSACAPSRHMSCRFAIVAAMLAIALMGCRSDGQATSVVDQASTASVLLNGDYQKIATCTYERLDKAVATGTKKIDLDGSSRLALESEGVRYWELLFRSAGKNETKVDFSVVQTMRGPDTMSTGGIMRRLVVSAGLPVSLPEDDLTIRS